MGLKRGFKIIDMVLICHGVGHNDTICMAERKVIKKQEVFFAQ
jgi:hypothetical protein